MSSQLYEKPSHFLLEFLQNADDNTYTNSNPTLNFTYRNGKLRIDCNEIGFTRQNVEAICSISESTKAGANKSADNIGEKGIGFKSVFKVADIVWISSRGYTFKFDKSMVLGMIAPTWTEFPEHTLPGYTSFLLQLSGNCDQQELIQELMVFDPNLLLFLRKVREINIQVSQENGQLWTTSIRKTLLYENDETIAVLNFDQRNMHGNMDPTTIVSVSQYTLRYVIRQHRVESLPIEPKRPNWSHSTLLLAFPDIVLLSESEAKAHKVYAFLPIRNYGFKVR